MYASIHNHSTFSKFDGESSVEVLTLAAAEMGMPALALTDHGTLAGLETFKSVCFKVGIQPILGCEFYLCKDASIKEKNETLHHLLILVKYETGLKNMIALDSFAASEGFYRKPRIDFATLAGHHEGLICATACSQGFIPQLIYRGRTVEAERELFRYRELFGDDFYLEVVRYENPPASQIKINEFLVAFGKANSFPLVASSDVHYVRNPERLPFGSCNPFIRENYLRSPEEMTSLYADIPEALENTLEIADKCSSPR